MKTPLTEVQQSTQAAFSLKKIMVDLQKKNLLTPSLHYKFKVLINALMPTRDIEETMKTSKLIDVLGEILKEEEIEDLGNFKEMPLTSLDYNKHHLSIADAPQESVMIINNLSPIKKGTEYIYSQEELEDWKNLYKGKDYRVSFKSMSTNYLESRGYKGPFINVGYFTVLVSKDSDLYKALEKTAHPFF